MLLINCVICLCEFSVQNTGKLKMFALLLNYKSSLCILEIILKGICTACILPFSFTIYSSDIRNNQYTSLYLLAIQKCLEVSYTDSLTPCFLLNWTRSIQWRYFAYLYCQITPWTISALSFLLEI